MAKTKQPIDMARAHRLEFLIKDSGMAQKEVAKKCNYSPQALNAMVKGRAHITEDKAKHIIERAFPDVRIGWLLGYTGSNFSEDEKQAQTQLLDFSEELRKLEDARAIREKIELLAKYITYIKSYDSYSISLETDATDSVDIVDTNGFSIGTIKHSYIVDLINSIDDYAAYSLGVMIRKHMAPINENGEDDK